MSPKTLKEWCVKNGYDGVTKECVLSAFQSDNPKIQELAKRKRLEGMIDVKKEEK